MLIRVGLPYLPSAAAHPYLMVVRDLKARCLISVNSLYRPGRGFARAPITAWTYAPAIDSAGFVATIRYGGYRWSVEEYVDAIVKNFDNPLMPHPWSWWSAMDFCCEPEIAANRAEVARRMQATLDHYAETMAHLTAWRREGETDTPDPLPILQGRTPADYVTMARDLAAVIDATHACTCPDEDCDATFHRSRKGLPELVGVGSVCRREVAGPEGILNVLGALDAALPTHVRLHLFGVKGALLRHPEISVFAHRIASVDSLAWDFAARQAAIERRKTEPAFSNTVAHRASHMRRWYLAQRQPVERQRSLFAPRSH